MLLVTDQEGNQAMGHSLEASGLLTQMERQGTITLDELVRISFQQFQDSQTLGAVCSLQMILK